MYTLYYAPGTASMVVHLALLEIGTPYRLERIDFSTQAQRDPGYLALNPSGTVPTLIVDDRPYTESAALLMMLADRHPEARLVPAPGTPERNLWYQWIAYLSNPLASTFREWFYPKDLGVDEHPPEIRAALQRRIEEAWDRLDSHLVAHGPYMLGGEFSGVDLHVTMLMRWSRNMPKPATRWPSLLLLADRIRGRDSWKKMSELEGLTGW